ncbi:MAG: hypothetical protein EYC62_01935 [Alphaproteobacteria bacterium]|nr:MAG: hypothetical protein EYC62_01935 [Alphaproteobacteria bacterium]
MTKRKHFPLQQSYSAFVDCLGHSNPKSYTGQASVAIDCAREFVPNVFSFGKPGKLVGWDLAQAVSLASAIIVSRKQSDRPLTLRSLRLCDTAAAFINSVVVEMESGLLEFKNVPQNFNEAISASALAQRNVKKEAWGVGPKAGVFIALDQVRKGYGELNPARIADDKAFDAVGNFMLAFDNFLSPVARFEDMAALQEAAKQVMSHKTPDMRPFAKMAYQATGLLKVVQRAQQTSAAHDLPQPLQYVDARRIAPIIHDFLRYRGRDAA